MRAPRHDIIFTAVLLSSSWCTVSAAEPVEVAARIGTHEITIEELRQFREDATASYREPEEGLEAWRFYLQTMIDMELMLIEAVEQRLGHTQGFANKWNKDRRQKLIDEYSTRNIIRDLDLAVDDMRQQFIQSKWNRMLRLAHIRTATEAEAQKALRDLEQGRDFSQVARQVSTVPTTAAVGGQLEHWFGRSNLEEFGLNLEIGEGLFELQVGEVSQVYRVQDSYEIFKVLDESPAPEHYRAAHMRANYWREFQSRWKSMVDGLRDRMNARIDGEAVRFLVDRMAGSDGQGILLGPEEQRMVLCRGDGFELTVLDFTETYNALWFIRSISFDSTSIAQFVERDVMPRALVYQAALDEGLDEDPVMAEWLQEKRNSLLLEALGRKEVVEAVEVDSATIRAFYDANTNLFMEPEEMQIAEILLSSRSQAEELLPLVRDGADMEALAVRHSIRADTESGHGHLHMHKHPSERRVFGDLYDAVLAAPVGELVGPIQLDEGYSIFRVIERTPPHPTPFEGAASRAEWWLKKQEEKHLFDALFVRLRDKYSSRVVVFDGPLGKLAAN